MKYVYIYIYIYIYAHTIDFVIQLAWTQDQKAPRLRPSHATRCYGFLFQH